MEQLVKILKEHGLWALIVFALLYILIRSKIIINIGEYISLQYPGAK